MDIAYSIEGVPIRLSTERWFHIVENHDDLAGYFDDILTTIENPDLVLTGQRGSLIATKGYGHRRYLMVVYRQLSKNDGFVITAFFTDRIERKKILWQK